MPRSRNKQTKYKGKIVGCYRIWKAAPAVHCEIRNKNKKETKQNVTRNLNKELKANLTQNRWKI